MIKALLMVGMACFIMSVAYGQETAHPDVVSALFCDTDTEMEEYLRTATDAGELDQAALDAINEKAPATEGGPACAVLDALAFTGDDYGQISDTMGRIWVLRKFLVVGGLAEGQPRYLKKPITQWSAYLLNPGQAL